MDFGDEVITSPPARGDGPTGSEASAAASLAGLSAIGLGLAPLPPPEKGDSIPVASCLIDGGLEELLIEAVSESRSEGLGEPGRMPGILNALVDRRITPPTFPQRFFLEGGDAEVESVDIVEIESNGCEISGKENQHLASDGRERKETTSTFQRGMLY